MLAPAPDRSGTADKGVSMDVNKVLQELKARPGFTDHVGMMLVHNGVVRGWSRKDHAPVSSITVSHDQAKMDAICHEMEQRPGIFAIVAQANGGELQPGDDLLLLVVAGDIRENVKATFAELLDRIKSEAVIKQEHRPEASAAASGGPCGTVRVPRAHAGHSRKAIPTSRCAEAPHCRSRRHSLRNLPTACADLL